MSSGRGGRPIGVLPLGPVVVLTGVLGVVGERRGTPPEPRGPKAVEWPPQAQRGRRQSAAGPGAARRASARGRRRAASPRKGGRRAPSGERSRRPTPRRRRGRPRGPPGSCASPHDLPEEALGPEDEDEDQDGEGEDVLVLGAEGAAGEQREVRGGERLDEPEYDT